MSDFRWIQTSMFLVLLHLTVKAAQFSSFTVRDEDEVTLPCENMLKDQDRCSRTTWLFSVFTKTAAKELVSFGQISKNSKSKPDRLSVTANCSLVIKKVTVEDVGLYTCRRLRSGQHQDTDVYLSLINMSEFKDADEVMLYCSVSTYGGCGHTVKWLYEGNDVAKHNEDVNTSRSDCSAAVSFSTSHFIYTAMYRESFKCQVTDGYTGEVQLFPFSPQSSSEKPGKGAIPTRPRSSSTTTTTTTPTTTTILMQEGCSALNYIMLVMRVAELVLITAITVLLIRAAGKQRPPDDNTVPHDGDGHGGTVKYENAGDPSASFGRP